MNTNNMNNIINLGYYGLTRDSTQEFVDEIINKKYEENKNECVRMIYYVRDCYSGLGERDVAFKMLNCLKRYHNDTYKLNLRNIIDHCGRYKDLLELATMDDKGDLNDSFELDTYANILREDLEKIKNGKNPSLAVKWAPREQKQYNNCAHALSKKLFPNTKKYLELYRKQYLVPLNKKIKIVENYMCSNKWDTINYDIVPKNALKKYCEAFEKHDSTRFIEFIWKKHPECFKNNTIDEFSIDTMDDFKDDDLIFTKVVTENELEDTPPIHCVKDDIMNTDTTFIKVVANESDNDNIDDSFDII